MQCVWPAWPYGMLGYSRDELLKFQGNNNISRSVRKTLFRYNIWCPKTRRLVLKPRVSTKRTFQAVKGRLLNTRSINEKESSICELITDNQLDLLALTETWCTDKSSVSLGLIQPPGYSVIHLPRQDRRGGGVGLLYRDSYKAKRVKVEKFSSFEHQTVSLSCGTEQLLVICVYLNSGVFTQDFSSQFSELISFLQTTVQNIWLSVTSTFMLTLILMRMQRNWNPFSNNSILFNMWIYPRTLLGIH